MSGWEVSTITLGWADVLWIAVAVAVFVAILGPLATWAGHRSGAWVAAKLFGPRSPEPTREVVVLCRDESSFGGVELRRDTGGILLGAPKVLPDDGPPVKLEGDLWVPADNVRAVQIVTRIVREPFVGLRTERQSRQAQ